MKRTAAHLQRRVRHLPELSGVRDEMKEQRSKRKGAARQDLPESV